MIYNMCVCDCACMHRERDRERERYIYTLKYRYGLNCKPAQCLWFPVEFMGHLRMHEDIYEFTRQNIEDLIGVMVRNGEKWWEMVRNGIWTIYNESEAWFEALIRPWSDEFSWLGAPIEYGPCFLVGVMASPRPSNICGDAKTLNQWWLGPERISWKRWEPIGAPSMKGRVSPPIILRAATLSACRHASMRMYVYMCNINM